MPSLIVLAWTAYVTMCEDLLEACLDLRPKWLLPLKGRGALRQLKPCESMTLKGTIISQSDNSSGPGNRKRLNFRALNGIRDAYYLAFNVSHKKIDAALNAREIDSLYALCNITVHKAGVVDGLFLHRVEGLPEFSHASKGHPLPLDFGLVTSIIRPAMISGIKLIVAVNKWLIDHPDSRAK